MLDIVYFSNYSGNTRRFVDKLGVKSMRIPINQNDSDPLRVYNRYVLFVPTYGGGSENSAIPKQVRHFLNIEKNRDLLVAVVGLGNTNFGEHYCKAAELISAKTGVPILGRVEIFGTDEDVNTIKERLEAIK